MSANPRMFNTITKNPHLHYLLAFFFYLLLYLIFFAPVWGQDKIFLVGSDHLLQNLPNFFLPKTLWTNELQGGFPVAADPQVASWYPISYLLKWLITSPGMAWNLFVISAYILASFFSYGYTYVITQSVIGAYGGGIIYGMSGFMISHIEHTNMIHGAAWLPLSLWALEKLRHKITKTWFFLGVISITMNILAGHPQITVYSLTLISLSTLIFGLKAPVKASKYYQISALVLILGITLASIQIIPTLELSRLGVRDKISFGFYTGYTLPPPEIVKMIFPYFFGGSFSQLYNTSYFGSWTLTETTGYVGISGLILAVIGFISHRRQTIAQFWLVIVLLSLIIAFGESTPLAWLSYQIPIHNQFRCLARHFCEMSLGISVLAAMGIQSLQSQKVSQSLFAKMIGISTVIFLGALFYLNYYLKPSLISNPNLNGEKIFNVYQNPALFIPILLFISTIIVIGLVLFVVRRTNFKPIGILLIVLTVLDLSSFGYFWAWKQQVGNYDFVTIESYPHAVKYRDILKHEGQRIISLQGISGDIQALLPNLSSKWQVANASIYNPLILERYTQILSSDSTTGIQDSRWAQKNNQIFNLMAIRYVFMKTIHKSNFHTHQGILWMDDDIQMYLGQECAAHRDKIREFNYPFPQPIEANAIAIVNYLECSQHITDNTPVLQIKITDVNGEVVTKTLKAGKDTSELKYHSEDSNTLIKHRQAENIFATYSHGNEYLSMVSLGNTHKIKNLQLKYLPEKASIRIKKITFIDQEKEKFYPLHELKSLLSNQSRWRYVEDIHETSIYENKDVLPRVWLVPQVITLTPEEIIHTIKTSSLPDNNIYQPQKMALVEENLDFQVSEFDSQAQAKIISNTPTTIDIETKSLTSSFLVLSDTYYPGWQATIDGKKTKIFLTNYVARGIVLPPGNHIVKFEFKPVSFHLGLGLSLASLFVLGYFLLISRQFFPLHRN